MNEKTIYTVILRYGNFKYSATTDEFKEIIRIPKPIGSLSIDNIRDHSTIDPSVLEFRYSKRLNHDILEYIYYAER